MKSRTPTIDQQRAKYKGWQAEAAVFGVPAGEFNEKVKAFLRKGNPTPTEWVHGAIQVAGTITQHRCCPKATRVPCMCEVSWTCPDHGTRCRGSHD
jgi:hypothetical protein